MANAATTIPGRGQIKVASGINLALGGWLIIAPFLLTVSTPAMWNDVLAGIAVLLLAGTRVAKPDAGTKGASWTNVLVGAWLIIAPFVLGYGSQVAIWNDVIVGVLLVAFGWWSGSQPRINTRPSGQR